MTLATTDYGTIGTGVAVAFLAMMSYIQNHQSKQREKKVDILTEKVEEVHKLTNGGMSEQLKIGMISAQTLAAVSPKPEYIELAKIATEKYRLHSEAEKNKGKPILQT